MKKDKVNLCACLGPMYNEPHCPCTMERMGLERSAEWKEYNSPANVKRREKQLEKALAKMFGWKGEKK